MDCFPYSIVTSLNAWSIWQQWKGRGLGVIRREGIYVRYTCRNSNIELSDKHLQLHFQFSLILWGCCRQFKLQLALFYFKLLQNEQARGDAADYDVHGVKITYPINCERTWKDSGVFLFVS